MTLILKVSGRCFQSASLTMHMWFRVPAQLQQDWRIKCFWVSRDHSFPNSLEEMSACDVIANIPSSKNPALSLHGDGAFKSITITESFHRTPTHQFRSTRLLNCHSWTRVRAARCRWSRCGRCAGSACSPWSVWGVRLASEPMALLPGSPAESPRSWCSAWPAAGSRSCWVFSRAGAWGWVSAALRRLCWHDVGASAHVCWWTPSWSWYCGTSLSVVLKLYERWSIRHKSSGMKNSPDGR